MQNTVKPTLLHRQTACENCGRLEDCVYNHAHDRWCCAGCAIELASRNTDYAWAGLDVSPGRDYGHPPKPSRASVR